MSKDEEDAKVLLDSVSGHDEMCEWDKCGCLERVQAALSKAREEAWEEGTQAVYSWPSYPNEPRRTNPYTPRSGSKGG